MILSNSIITLKINKINNGIKNDFTFFKFTNAVTNGINEITAEIKGIMCSKVAELIIINLNLKDGLISRL